MSAPPIDWHDVCTNTEPEPGDHQPTRFDCRQHEIRDLGGQGAGPYALWTVETVPTQEKYL